MRLLLMEPIDDWNSHSLRRLATILAASEFNTACGLLERLMYSRRVARITLEEPPIFILGHWRSGTTLLHNLLARDPQFSCPTQYECAFPSHFLLTERWLPRLLRRWTPPTRPMDNMPSAWDLPGEDETALLLMTLLSPYLAAAFPHQPDKAERFHNLRQKLSPKELKKWKSSFLTFLKKVTLRRPGRLVLKSPTHTSRIPLLLEMFPDARFIHIVRNPYDVFSSTMHLQRVLFEENSFTGAVPDDLEERVLSTYTNLYQAYHLYRVKIPAGQRYELRFEDLVDDPAGRLTSIYTHFALRGADEISARLADHIPTHREYRRNVYHLTEEQARKVADRWQPAFNRYAYALERGPSESSR
jgi:hypothetical protein